MSGEKTNAWRRLLLSETLADKNKSHKIAYIAVFTALAVVMNTFFEFKMMDTQFSFTIVTSALTGIVIGPVFGFVACFLGDLVGFLYHSAGFAYMPWIGLSMGLTAVIAGLIMNGIPAKNLWFRALKLGAVCVLTFLICTVAINTTAFWILYSKVDYWTYLCSRLFVQGQIWNSIFNYVLLFIVLPILGEIKQLRIKI